MSDISLSVEEWSRLLTNLELPTYAEAIDALADARGLRRDRAETLVDNALDDGPLIKDDAGAFDELYVENTTLEGGSTVETPTPDTAETGFNSSVGETNQQNTAKNPDDSDLLISDDVARDAFADAIRFFHAQLDRELPGDDPPATPREYYEDVRGWDPATIDELMLGWAPASDTALLDYLMRKGYGRAAIIGTGLFTDDLTPLWCGRYVLPYLDRDAEPVYAIGRCTGDKGGGAAGYDGHPADILAGKYAKLKHTDERVPFDEPIWGVHTLEDSAPVVIAEGIADAITAVERGYSVLSPVTKEFKREHFGPLLDALGRFDVPSVTVVPDAERAAFDRHDDDRPEAPERIRDAVTVPATAPGIGGALRTAEYLADHGVDVRVADLPRHGLRKVDLDDYLQVWADDVDAVLRSAKPPAAFPEYSAATHDPTDDRGGQTTSDTDGEGRGEADGNGKTGDERRSALWDLDIGDLTDRDAGDRGKNPFRHTGESENYFVVREGNDGDLVATDYKGAGGKAVYNALTALLVADGQRSRDTPEGALSDIEVFHAWKRARKRNDLDTGDPVPYRAILGLVDEHDLAPSDDIPEDPATERLPEAVYNDALALIREQYGLDPGREPVGAEPAVPIPFKKLDVLTGTDRKRYARKQGFEIPSTDDAREQLRNAVFRELRAGNATVIDAPTALGKSYTVATEPWRNHAGVTGEAPVVQLHKTRDARDEAARTTDQHGADGRVLKGRKELSPLARGDHDPPEDDDEDPPEQVVTIDGLPASDWFDQMCEERGLPFSTALVLARERNDQGLDELPPKGQEDPAVAQWNGIPRNDDGHPAVDVIHATHQFAYVPSLRQHTNVILDEQPDYTVDIGQERIRRLVNAYLQAIDAPVTTWERFVTLAQHTANDTDAAAERDALDDVIGRDPGREWYVEDPDAHALAPDLTQAIWNALRWEDPVANGRRSAEVFHEPPRLDTDDGDQYGGTWLRVVIDAENTIRRVWNTPNFTQARAVIGLDAHPSMPMWVLNTAANMTRDAVLDPTERRLWRRYERGLATVQIGEATRPRSGPNAREWMNEERVQEILDKIRDHYGDGFDTAGTTDQVESKLRQLLEATTGEELDDDHTIHFGEEKSRNPDPFTDADAGYVYGCMDPGDEMVLDTLAALDLNAEPATVETDDGEIKREKGRTFDGPDAETAQAVLASVRENHVAQMAGRYARNPDDPESGAVVFVDTDAAPPGFTDLQTAGVEWVATPLQREIIDELAARENATAQEIADAVDCTKEHVRETLKRGEERDRVIRHRAAGDHGADVYQANGAEMSIVDLGLETTNAPLKESTRWSLAIWRRHDTDTDAQRGATPDQTKQATLTGGGSPSIESD